ncbi:MAG: YcxB family protein [Bacteroidota bacterium]
MTIEYQLQEEDFLAFQLFTASQSRSIQQKKRKGQLFITIGSLVLASYFYANKNLPLTIYFVLFAVVTLIFYPQYFKWRYKRHYERYIREHYAKRFGETATLEFKSDVIYSKDRIGEGTIKLSEIEKVEETAGYFFLKISSGFTLILPKTTMKDITNFKIKLTELGLSVNNFTNWHW